VQQCQGCAAAVAVAVILLIRWLASAAAALACSAPLMAHMHARWCDSCALQW
jgi:hypothetical protein